MPTAQLTHSVAPARLLVEPGLQSVHAVIELRGAYEPGAHGEQESGVALVLRKVPAVHMPHVLSSGFEKVPFAQRVHLVAFGVENAPSAHTVHAVAVVVLEKRPPGQIVHCVAPDGTYEPAAHGMHVAWPVRFCQRPLGHAGHSSAVLPVVDMLVPGAHSVQFAEPGTPAVEPLWQERQVDAATPE